MNFENQIKQWVNLDNQLKNLNDKAKEIKIQKNYLEKNITDYVHSNNLSNSTVQISDGKLKFLNGKKMV